VRCARCSHTWQADLTQDASNPAASPQSPLAEAEGASRNTALASALKLSTSVRLFISIGVAALALLILLVFLFDCQNIAKKWPWFEGLYNSIGLHIYHAGEGLKIEDVRSELHYEDGVMHLMVAGNIVNKTKKAQLVPPIMASAVGSDGNVMQNWQIDPPAVTLEAGGRVPFSSTINSPKGSVVEMNLIFGEAKNASE